MVFSGPKVEKRRFPLKPMAKYDIAMRYLAGLQWRN